MFDLSGKTCLVTAAGQGIGRATAKAMAACGARVTATDVDAGLLAGLETQGIAIHALDVLDPAAIAAAQARHGAPDILVNCAGYVAHGTILDCDEADWTRSQDLNVTALYRMCRAFLPGMLAAGGGSIVNIASAVSSLIAAPNRFVYGATKAAVIGITKSIAADFVTHGIRCNAICPGTVDTPSLHDRLRATGDYEAAHAAFVGRQPMGRLGEAQEIAALAVYLASDEARFTTGTAQIIDGGWSNV